MCYVHVMTHELFDKKIQFPLTDPVHGLARIGLAWRGVCEWRLLVLRRESLAFTRTFYEFDEIVPLRRSPNVPVICSAGSRGDRSRRPRSSSSWAWGSTVSATGWNRHRPSGPACRARTRSPSRSDGRRRWSTGTTRSAPAARPDSVSCL